MRSAGSKRGLKILVGKFSGYCFGVKRAIKMAEKTLDETGDKAPVYSLHPIIHNRQAVKKLEEKGLKTTERIPCDSKGARIIISSHGAGVDVFRDLKERGAITVNATCPRVLYAQKLIKDLNSRGFYILIIGEKRHPEVRGLLSLAANGRVVNSQDDVSRLPKKYQRLAVIAQTTQSKNHVNTLISGLLKRNFSELEIFNTLCNDTLDRQNEALALAQKVDVMIVAGGKHSANTRRLFELSKSKVVSYHIEEADEIKPSWVKGASVVGLVSGASTPDWIIDEIISKIKAVSKG